MKEISFIFQIMGIPMKLAEALIRRADMQKRQAQLADRINENLIVQEGDLPSEDPNSLFKQYESISLDLCRLVCAINHTNIQTPFHGTTLMAALADRERLRAHIAVVRHAASSAVVKNSYSRSEIRFVPTVDASSLREKADRLSKDLRELEIRIQEVNWQTELMSV